MAEERARVTTYRKMRGGLLAALLAVVAPIVAGSPALAQPGQANPPISQSVAVCDQTTGFCLKPASNGSLAVTGGSSSGSADVYSAGNALPATLNSTYAVTLGSGQATTGFSLTGLTASGATLTIQYSNDKGANWAPIRYISNDVQVGTTTLTADGQYTVPSAGHTMLRLIVTTAGTGTITVTSNASIGPKQVVLGGLLPGFYTAPQTAGSGNVVIGQGASATAANTQAEQGVVAVGVAGTENPVRTGCDANQTSTTTVTQGRMSLKCSRQGELLPPVTMTTAGYVITKVAITANTSTQVCPAVSAANTAAYISEEFQSTAAGGISLTGGALTQATIGTAAGTTPDFQYSTGAYYLDPAPAAVARTWYGAAGFTSCVQRFGY